MSRFLKNPERVAHYSCYSDVSSNVNLVIAVNLEEVELNLKIDHVKVILKISLLTYSGYLPVWF